MRVSGATFIWAVTAGCCAAWLAGAPCAAGETVALGGLPRVDPATAEAGDDGKLLWYDVRALVVEGRGWDDTEHFYHRFPAKAKGVVRDSVWDLSTRCAGLCARFVTDADTIAARWTLTSASLDMPHFPATGVSGLDLYVHDAGVWKWVGAGRPTKQTNEAQLADGIPEGAYEFMLYLPLYNGLESVEIGLPADATLAKPPPRPPERAKPIVYYGTSIAQGGCASRPGMAHTALIGRMLDWHVINLGFSGNGTMDLEVGDLMAQLDAAAYVIDCAPNMQPDDIAERTEPLVRKLRAARPDTPIVLVENIEYQAGFFLPKTRQAYEAKNAALRAAYDGLVAAGVTGLHYVPCRGLLGDDGQGAVDGTHPTDLGFYRFAEALAPVLQEILSDG